MDCMVYRAPRAYQDHQVSETFVLPVDRHCIGFGASVVCEIFAVGFPFRPLKLNVNLPHYDGLWQTTAYSVRAELEYNFKS